MYSSEEEDSERSSLVDASEESTSGRSRFKLYEGSDSLSSEPEDDDSDRSSSASDSDESSSEISRARNYEGIDSSSEPEDSDSETSSSARVSDESASEGSHRNGNEKNADSDHESCPDLKESILRPENCKSLAKCESPVESESVVRSENIVKEDGSAVKCESKTLLKSENSIKDEHSVPANPVVADSSTKSLKHLKSDFRKLVKVHAVNSGGFATGGLLTDAELPNCPLIHVSGYGLLPFPLIKTTFDSIKPLCKQSPYGMGEETLVDVSVRNSFQLDPSQFKIKNDLFSTQLDKIIQKKVKSDLGLHGANICGKIYKLLIYETGGKFDEHKDTEKEDNMFGTLIVQLPSVFTGGNLVVKHLKSSKTFENSSKGSSTHCKFVAHYASCPHQLNEVTSGYRAALIYSLCWDGNGMKPSPYVASTNTVKLTNTMNLLMDLTEVSYICLGLEYEYSDASVKGKSLKFFKGKDKNVVKGLKNALDYDHVISGKDRWEFFIATANKQIKECGDCQKYNDGRRGAWGGCGEDCYMVEELSRSFHVDGFVSLSQTSSMPCGKLRLKIDPEVDIINFPWHKVSTGQAKRRRKEEYSDEEFWGTEDLGEGCSGPSGNEGSTRDRWYKKKVIVLWRSDCSLAVQCSSNLTDGVSHVLNLLKRGEVEEGKIGFEFLSTKLDDIKQNRDLVIQMLEMCLILNIKEDCLNLLETLKIYGIFSSKAAEIVAESISSFPDDSHKNTVKDIIKSTNRNELNTLLAFCKDNPLLEPQDLVPVLVNDIILKDSSGTRSYNGYNNNSSTSPIQIVLKYMLENNVLPDAELNQLINKIDSLSDLCSAVSLSVEKHSVNVLNLLLMRFVELYSKRKDQMNSYSYYRPQHMDQEDPSVDQIFLTLVEGVQKHNLPLSESISTLINIIKNMSNFKQEIIKPFLNVIKNTFSKSNEEVSECLQEACLFRIETLEEGILSKGEPTMNWHQPNAVVPRVPEIQEFLRGPKKQMGYGRGTFTNVKEARRWASNHAIGTGCYMTLNPSGVGRNAVVIIVKTIEGFNAQVTEYKTLVNEYNSLLKCVPRHQSCLTPKKQSDVSTPINPESTADKENQFSLQNIRGKLCPLSNESGPSNSFQNFPPKPKPKPDVHKMFKPFDVITID